MDLAEPPQPTAATLPEWLTVPAACQRSSLGRTTLFALLKDGKVKGKLVKTRASNIRGKRLVFRASLDAFLADPAAV